ncbi:hypothetical protein ANN_22329 [Periplaneta americana]|uniref:Cytochrome b-c1 complex subunit 7 n=1 Tax=Periplaneta americana TaxID=6978 RepID=A0ABQ8S7V5_PERAM|nr:hypothetical protein ANN_22329 [Periplaneta americana]
MAVSSKASGFTGLHHDDCYDEDNPDVKEALRRLPAHLVDERNFRITRALQLSLQKIVLPREEWVKFEEMEACLLFPCGPSYVMGITLPLWIQEAQTISVVSALAAAEDYTSTITSRRLFSIYNLPTAFQYAYALCLLIIRFPRTCLTEEKLDDIGANLERSPNKSLTKLAQQVGVSVSPAHRATKLLHIKPYRFTWAHCLKPADPAIRVRYCEWYLASLNDGLFDPQLVFFSDEAWFHLNGRVNSRNSRYWCAENPNGVYEVPHYDRKIGVWCAVSAK